MSWDWTETGSKIFSSCMGTIFAMLILPPVVGLVLLWLDFRKIRNSIEREIYIKRYPKDLKRKACQRILCIKNPLGKSVWIKVRYVERYQHHVLRSRERMRDNMMMPNEHYSFDLVGYFDELYIEVGVNDYFGRQVRQTIKVSNKTINKLLSQI